MAGPTTIKEFSLKKKEVAASRLESAKAAVASASGAVNQALKDQAARMTESLALAKQAEDLRKQLQAVPTSADGQGILAQLQTNTIDSRAKQHELLRAGEGLALAQRAMARAESEIGDATAALALASAELDAATKDEEKRTAFIDRLGQPPFGTLKDDAAAAKDSKDLRLKAAQDRVNKDIPVPLQDRARQRNQVELDRLMDARGEALVAESLREDAWGNTDGVAKQASVFARARQNLQTYVETGPGRFALATAVLKRIPEAPPQTSDEAVAIDIANFPNADDALKKEDARNAARGAVEKAEDELLKAELTVLAANPFQDLTTHTDVKKKAGNLKTSQNALSKADTAYTPEMRDLINRWEAAIPDASWRLLSDLESAVTTLTDLSNSDPTQLIQDINAVEQALAEALDNELLSLAIVRTMTERAGERNDTVAVLTFTAPARSHAALRGDA